MATVFSYRYIRDAFSLDWSHSGDARYDSAAADVEKLLAIDPASVGQLRTHQQVISLIDAPLILVPYPSIGADLASELARKFA